MAKRTNVPPTHTIIVYNASGEKINGTATSGHLATVKSLARDIMRTLPDAWSTDVRTYEPGVNWQQQKRVVIINQYGEKPGDD